MNPDTTVAVAIISPNADMQETLGRALENHPNVGELWTLAAYPSGEQLHQLSDASSCVAFLDYSDPVQARTVAAALDRSHGNLVTVACHPRPNVLDLLELMQLGIRAVVEDPGNQLHVWDVFDRSRRKLTKGDSEDGIAPLYAFLPARPGSGATTVAVHATAAAARLGNQRTLLIDFDLRLGLTSFLLKLHGERSVMDALALSPQLDDTLWESLVNRRGRLDILGSAPVDFSRERNEVHTGELLRFVRQRYTAVCADLPGELREHEVETLRQAQEIFLVCTPEIANLHMTRRKAEALKVLGVYSHVSVLVNRVHSKNMQVTVQQIEDILQLPVRLTLPAADEEIAAATRDAVTLEGSSAFAERVEKLGRCMIVEGIPPEPEAKRPRSFIDFFSVSQIRERTPWK